MFGPNQSMEIESGWANTVDNVLINDSPKESSSIESNISSSNKEIAMLPHDSPKQLLFDCAVTISNGNVENASTMIDELRQRVSIQGEPSERIAAYMVEALAARMATSGKGLYKALKCKEAPSLDRLSAMQVLFEVCPCFRFGFMAANGAIIEALENERKVHIIDFDINQGSQYIALLQTLANHRGKLPLLRLTGVDDPESMQRATGSLNLIGQRLEQLAEALEVPFEFQAVVANTEAVTPAILDHHPDESLIVNFAFQLHHMPDESVSTVNQRDVLPPSDRVKSEEPRAQLGLYKEPTKKYFWVRH
ncbi:Transcription factor [Heracleum sosnowskyi]|uniref:Transcription factor n=1 Tax=Heracleum sosnowskyi TaxID=360622 RepID=A0AAD8J664_9APIA|nr:Transcription factor [Heracleum sosnowskyi]